MHVQLVTFGLQGISEEEYHAGCRDEAGIFADLPGLSAKIWLKDSAEGTYGAVYLWNDRQSFERYVGGEVFKSIEDDPTLTGVTSRDFDVYDDLTAITSPALSIAPDAS